ncbi:MAG: leucyl aminopeptidase [Asgard group archaeon]|nr:leucyl aminopeptidase [Asgard group archaeon]
MKVSTSTSKITDIDAPLVVLGILEDAANDPLIKNDSTVVGKIIKELASLGDFTGKSGELVVAYTREELKAKRLLLVGLGKEESITEESIRKAIGNASRKARDLDVKKVALAFNYFNRNKLALIGLSEAIAQGMILGSFQNLKYRTKDIDKYKHLEELIVFSPDLDIATIKKGIKQGEIIANAVNLCRSLAWGPSNDITPTKLAEEALRLQKDFGIQTTVFDRKKSEEVGLTSFLAVAQGTEEPPKFIIMEYKSAKQDADTIALIGKAITFDTGGISIKPSQDMGYMKADMTGGAVVISAMEAIAQLKPDVNVVGIVPATDNMPSGKAYKPGDIVKTYSGLTVEVISTDAEGRMIINDALSYAAKNYKPKAMFDFATLTGAMMIALGNHAIGYFANNDEISAELEAASKTSGEKVWRMPLWDDYDEQLKSDIADLQHTGGRPGGAITAARFLSNFVMDVPWIHMDIAGYSNADSDKGYNPKGSKGPAVRLIVDVVRNWKK